MVQSKNRNGATTTPPTKALFFMMFNSNHFISTPRNPPHENEWEGVEKMLVGMCGRYPLGGNWREFSLSF